MEGVWTCALCGFLHHAALHGLGTDRRTTAHGQRPRHPAPARATSPRSQSAAPRCRSPAASPAPAGMKWAGGRAGGGQALRQGGRDGCTACTACHLHAAPCGPEQAQPVLKRSKAMPRAACSLKTSARHHRLRAYGSGASPTGTPARAATCQGRARYAPLPPPWAERHSCPGLRHKVQDGEARQG